MFSPYDNANAREESDAMQKLSPEDKSARCQVLDNFFHK